MKIHLITLLAIFLSVSINAQVPTKFNSKKDKDYLRKIKTKKEIKTTHKMPPLSLNSLRDEDLIDEQNGLPMRFGKAFDVDIGTNYNEWNESGNDKIWTTSITSQGAYSINLFFDQFVLNNSAEVYIINQDTTITIGPITSKQNNQEHVYATDLLKGDYAKVILIESKHEPNPSTLHLSRVVHGYKNLFEKNFGDSGNCHNDINCSVGDDWQNESNSVAMILVDGERVCTGTMINNACNDLEPNFLTAFHCLDLNVSGTLSQGEKDALSSWVFRFQYKSPSCNGGDDTNYNSFSGATFKSAWATSDFALMELNQTPLPYTGISYAGWYRGAATPSSTVGIHHPSGDVMKISFDDDSPSTDGYAGGSGSVYWNVVWDDGSTEGGSSGSSLFDQNHRIVGQLKGGYASCSNQNASDWHGRFRNSWTGGGTDATRLSNWLSGGTNLYSVNTISIPYISGAEVVCTSNSTFTLYNRPSNLTVTWTYSSSSLTYVSGQGTDNFTVKAKSGQSEMGYVTATFSSNCSSSLELTESFWVGKPDWHGLEVRDYSTKELNPELCLGDDNYLEVFSKSVSGQQIDEYDWNMISGGALYILPDTPYNIALIVPYGSYVSFEYKAHNTCGWTNYRSNQLYATHCGYFYSYNPNPVSSELTIEAETASNEVVKDNGSNLAIEFEAVLYNADQKKVKVGKSKGNKIKFNVSDLIKGSYFLHIIDENQVEKVQIIID